MCDNGDRSKLECDFHIQFDYQASIGEICIASPYCHYKELFGCSPKTTTPQVWLAITIGGTCVDSDAKEVAKKKKKLQCKS